LTEVNNDTDQIHPPSLVLHNEVGEEGMMATWELQEYISVHVQTARVVVFGSQFKTLKIIT